MRVLLVPGLLSPRSLLFPLRGRLEAEGHEVVLFRGWPTLTVFQYRDLLKQLRDEGPAAVIGHSLGGFIAILAAERRPDLFHAVIGLDPFIFDAVDIECPYYEVRGLESRLFGVGNAQLNTFAPHAFVPLDAAVQDFVVEKLHEIARIAYLPAA